MFNRVQKLLYNFRCTIRSFTARRINLIEFFEEFSFKVMPYCDAWAFLTYKSVRGFMLAGVLGITKQ